jgi:hypothetical protein
MTIATSTNKHLYAGTGAQTVFPFLFRIWRAEDLRVLLRDIVGGETVLSLGSGYTVAGVGSEEGGTVTLTGTAPVVGEYLLIKRVVPITQETDLVENAATPAAVMEGTFDRLTAMVQQVDETLGRAVLMKETTKGEEVVGGDEFLTIMARALDASDAASFFSSQAAQAAAGAGASASLAGFQAGQAEAAATRASASKQDAFFSAVQSAGSATQSMEAADNAGVFANQAMTARTESAAASHQARQASLDASASEMAAAASATNAATSEANALASKNAAATSATNAAGSATAATAARDEALASKNAAAASAAALVDVRARAARIFDWVQGLRPYSSYDDPDLARRTISTPTGIWGMLLDEYYQEVSIPLSLSSASVWDASGTDYTVAANRAGKDFYLYAISYDAPFPYVISANATFPTGAVAGKYIQIGGFHCLCAAVGTISDHPLSGYLAGDILPASVWDLRHRPICSPRGMVYVEGLGKWADIYLASVSAGRLVSVNGGTIADGASAPAFHWYKFSQWLGQIGKRLPTQHEFVALSIGANQGTNISGSADPGITTGHTDTAGRRMVSSVGCEDTCGVLWQWSAEPGGGAAGASWVAAYDGNDSGVLGFGYEAPNRAFLGGGWNDGAFCGSRCANWNSGPLFLYANVGARGVAEPLAVSL